MAEDVKIKYIDIGSENLSIKRAGKDNDVSNLINILAEKPLNTEINKFDDKDNIQKMIYVLNLLESLYAENNIEKLEFRHSYSNIFNTMVRLIPPGKDSLFNSKNNKLENLSNNIQWLKDILDENNGISIRQITKNEEVVKKVCDLQNDNKFNKGFFKLYDHILLEYARIAYSLDWIEKVKISEKELLDETKSNLSKLKEKMHLDLDELKEKMQKIQKEYVAILGIFAAIITAFFSGIGFSSSVLENMHQISIYRLTFTILLLGCVLFNILSILMNFINNIVELKYHKSKNTICGNITFCILLVVLYIMWKLQALGNASL